MRLLLDTHALLWWLTEDDRLGGQTRDLIKNRENDVLVSIVTLWEIALKVRIGKLKADVDQIARQVERNGFVLLGITLAQLRVLAALPAHHRDPFDHLLIAQAITEEATFVSDDRYVAQYPVQTISCYAASL